MATEIVALFVPIVSMVVIGLVIVAFYYYRHKSRKATQETIRQALERSTRSVSLRHGEDDFARRQSAAHQMRLGIIAPQIRVYLCAHRFLLKPPFKPPTRIRRARCRCLRTGARAP